MSVITFDRKKIDHKGKYLYDIYREVRIGQGWTEFKWESLSEPQKLVWARITDRLIELDVLRGLQ